MPTYVSNSKLKLERGVEEKKHVPLNVCLPDASNVTAHEP